MKVTSLLVAATFSVAAVLTPVKKAEAGLLMLNPVLVVAGLAGLIGSIIPVINEDNQHGAYARIFTPLFMTVGTIAVLDQDADKVEGALMNAFPTISPYIIREASTVLIKKANLIEYNENGLKSVSLTKEEFSDLEAAMPSDIDVNEVSAFKVLLTTPVVLN